MIDHPQHPDLQSLRILIDESDLINETSLGHTPDVLLLDEAAITARLRRLSESDPYFAKRNVCSHLERLSRRVADRMARLFSSAWSAPKEMVSEAIYFHVWSELCTIIPLRRLARSIARDVAPKKVLIILPRLDLVCLQTWPPNQLEPLILCWALQKEGCNAYLLCKVRLIGPVVRLHLHPSPATAGPRGQDLNRSLIAKGLSIVALDGIRGIDLVSEEVGDSVFLAGAHCMSLPPQRPILLLLVGSNLTSSPSIKLRKDLQSDFPPLRQFSAAWPADPLATYFDLILGPYFSSMVKRVRSFLDDTEISKAHVCDHLFIGSAILAHAIKERSGSVTLWPHSANPGHWDVRKGEHFDDIVVMTRAAGEIWRRRFPNKPLRIRPRLMLPPQRALRVFDPSAPLTVIVFGGAHFLARLPLFRIESHFRTYRRFFLLHQSSTSFVRIVFKPKVFETESLAA